MMCLSGPFMLIGTHTGTWGLRGLGLSVIGRVVRREWGVLLRIVRLRCTPLALLQILHGAGAADVALEALLICLCQVCQTGGPEVIFVAHGALK